MFRPLTTVSPASHFVGYDQSIRYGDMGSVLDTAAGILDTGTTLVLIASGTLPLNEVLQKN